MRAVLSQYQDAICFAQAARGAAVALRPVGWAVTLDLRRLAGSTAGEPPARPTDVARLEDLRLFRDPRVAAATALTCLELAREEIIDLRLGDIRADSAEIHLWHDIVTVPPVVRPILRAQLLSRRHAGAVAGDPLLAEGGRPISVRRLASVVLGALEEIGRFMPWETIDDQPARDERWLLERGVAVRWLARLERASRTGTERAEAERAAREVLEALASSETPPAATCGCTTAHVAREPHGGHLVPPNHSSPSAHHPWRR